MSEGLPEDSDALGTGINDGLTAIILSGLQCRWEHMRVVKAQPPDGMVMRLPDDSLWGIQAYRLDNSKT